LTLAVGLAAGLVAPSRACAHDTAGAELARSPWHAALITATSIRPFDLDLLGSSVLPAIADGSGSSSTGDGAESAGGGDPTVAPQVDLDASDDVDVEELCEKRCGTVQQINLLPEAIFERFEALPVLGVFVVPLTRGVTVEPGQGLASITFAVKPTRVTRGSGLVVIGRF
jgi:hypothetical protein